MVNEPRIIVNSEFFSSDLQTMYCSMCDQVREHRSRSYMPCCITATAAGYTLYGTYPRKEVIDARVTDFHNGVPVIEKVVIKDFRVQRMQHKTCRHTHALMFEWFIPYQKYSIRFVLLHLQLYFHSGISLEKYCLEAEIPISTFKRWQEWLKENMEFLTEMGIVRDRKENKENLMKWLLEILGNTGVWLLRSLSSINLALFQRHKMPADYTNYRILLFRRI